MVRCHRQLEQALCDYLGVDHLSLFTNGTIRLSPLCKLLRVTGEVITTPYSFVATAHALLWNNIKPVFADIDPRTCNLDPDRTEDAITFQRIADTYGLKVIYDAAHAFGVRYKGESLLKNGDLPVFSFHATEVFYTSMDWTIIFSAMKTNWY